MTLYYLISIYVHVVKEWLGCYFDSQGENKWVVGRVEENDGEDKDPLALIFTLGLLA
jgi:hypothetical protein